MWSPTHIKLTVHKAKDLKIKGKPGTNDVYVVVRLGEEKHRTSVRERTLTPEWNEDCDLSIPRESELNLILKLRVLHRNFFGISDELLGDLAIRLKDLNCYERPRTKWFALRNDRNSPTANEEYGQIQLTFTFLVRSLQTCTTSESVRPKLRKSLSIKGIADQLGDRLSLRRGSTKGESKLGSLSDLTHREQPSPSLLEVRSVPSTVDELYWNSPNEEVTPNKLLRSPVSSLSSSERQERRSSLDVRQTCHNSLQRHSIDASFLKTLSLLEKSNQNSSANRHTLGHIVYNEESSAEDNIDKTEDTNDLEIDCKDQADEDLDQIEDVLYTRADFIVDPTQTGVHQEVDKTLDKQDEVGEIEPPNYSQLDKDRQNFDMYDKQELIQLVLDQRAWIRSREVYLRDLEEYTDNLLLKVIECNCALLHNPYQHGCNQATKQHDYSIFKTGKKSVAKKWLSMLYRKSKP